MQHIKREDFEYLINLIIQYLGQLGVSNPVLNNATVNHIVNALSFGLKLCSEDKSKTDNVDKQYDKNKLKTTYGFNNKEFCIISPIMLEENDSYALQNLKSLKEKGICFVYNLTTGGKYKFCKFTLGDVSANSYPSKDKFVPICELIAEFYANLLKRQFSLRENIYFQIATLDILFDILFKNYKKVIKFKYPLKNILACVFKPVRPQYNDTEIDEIIIIDAFLNTCENLNAKNRKTLENYIEEKNNANLE